MLTSRWGLEPVIVPAEHAACTDVTALCAHESSLSSSRAAAAAAATLKKEGGVGLDRVTPPPSYAVDRLEEDDEPTGKRLWDCAKVLYDLVANPDPENVFSVRDKRVVELGAGTGALSVGLARAGASSVTCTDLPCHIPHIGSTIKTNEQHRRRQLKTRRRNPAEGEGITAKDITEKRAVAEVIDDVTQECAVRIEGLRWGDTADITRVLLMSNRERTTLSTAMPEAPDRGASGVNLNGKGVVADIDGNVEEAAVTQPASWAKKGTAASDVHGNALAAAGDAAAEGRDALPRRRSASEANAFDVIVLSEVLYWPALDIFQEDTRKPLLRTLVGLSAPGTRVILVYKERWFEREQEFIASCIEAFEVREIVLDMLPLSQASPEEADCTSIRGFLMVRRCEPGHAR